MKKMAQPYLIFAIIAILLHSYCNKNAIMQIPDFFYCLLQLINEENGPTLSYAVQNHFGALAMREGKTRRTSVHHQSLVTLSRK